MGYSPWGLKELDTTEQLTHTHTINHINFAFQNSLILHFIMVKQNFLILNNTSDRTHRFPWDKATTRHWLRGW